MTTVRCRRVFCRVRVHAGRAHVRPTLALLARPSVRATAAGNFTRPLVPQPIARSPRGEISAPMIEVALSHLRAGMAGAHPAPQEKRQ